MRAKIEKIGDQYGLMLPGDLVRACGFGAEATIIVQDKKLLVSAMPTEAREGWAEALRAIPQQELDRDYAELQSFREVPNAGDAEQWHWPDSESHEKV